MKRWNANNNNNINYKNPKKRKIIKNYSKELNIIKKKKKIINSEKIIEINKMQLHGSVERKVIF